jgi:hypothetical protein
MFSGVIVKSSPLGSGFSSSNRGNFGSYLRFQERLKKGIETENRICENLSSVDSGFYIHHLEKSGLRSHGTDIVISKKNEMCENPFETVRSGICAIEVLGVRNRNKKNNPVFTYHVSKNFYNWQRELLDNNILPVVAWEHDDKSFYAVMSADALFKGFWTAHGGEWHQQTGNVPISRLNDYCMNVCQLFDCIDWHMKTLRTYNDIKDNVPLVIGGNCLTSPSFKCRDPAEYDIALDDVKEYGYEVR